MGIDTMLKGLLAIAIIIATVVVTASCTERVSTDKPNVIHHKVTEC